MSNRTFRSLDAAPKLLMFTGWQWAALIADSAAVYGLIRVTNLPAKPAITLAVFLVGLPAALAYVSENGGLQLGALLRDVARWRCSIKQLPSATGRTTPHVIVSGEEPARPGDAWLVGRADMQHGGHER